MLGCGSKDVVKFITEFHTSLVLPREITSSFLTLIPKKNNPQSFSEYCPISLVGSLYEILAKLLAGRLKRVFGRVISNTQSAFLPGRQILDGVVVINELVDLAKRRKDSCVKLKVDFEKALQLSQLVLP